MTPETRYARSADVNIAYQVVGAAPRDLVLVPGWVTNIEVFWEEPACARFLERLASFTRLILFDKRGTGLSDRVADLPPMGPDREGALCRLPSYRHTLTEDDIKAHVQHYADKGVVSKWAVPSRVRTVAALDKTSVGKLEKKVMRQKYA
jgi:pimeloyl-ACP methyl ester carboxylesterase